MIARRPRSQATRRRGVVLILVLSMLGLLAVIGVSFAAFSGQARSAARVYSQKMNRPQADDLIEFAIRQLINDTTNPMSALYGHGLKRDMYGSDAAENGYYDRNPDGSFPTITAAPVVVYAPPALPLAPSPLPAEWTVTTNIPGYVGYNFTGWTMTIPGTGGNVAQTFEVVNGTVAGGFYVLEITGSHRPFTSVLATGMTAPNNGSIFSLDGRYRHAFNGSGMAALTGNVHRAMNGPGDPALNDPGNRNPGQFANYRVSGGLLEGDPLYAPRPFNVNLLGMDEDYDAPDLENWFLAAQSADGRTIIPSFHRPGILTLGADSGGTILSDMEFPHPDNFVPGTPDHRRAVRAISKILRPRPVDHPTAGFSTLEPDPVTGLIEYDVDNDGDGITDSVWVDLGHPVQRGPDGTLYKPLYSFMVVGLNGRMPLNTAGNLNARELVDNPFTPDFDEAGIPLFDHASHLGWSPSEINPKYALQNTFDNYQDPGPVNVIDDAKPDYSQFDNATYTDPISGAVVRHIPVSLSQLRSLLTGTRINQNNDSGEQNRVLVGGQIVPFHNNTVDSADFQVARNGGFSVDRPTNRAVAGRWGEPDAIPPELRRFPNPMGDPISHRLDRSLNFSGSRLNLSGGVDMPNPVRPGQSPYPIGQYLFDGIDNNTDTVDFYPERAQQEGPEAGFLNGGAFFRSNAHDAANMPILASERYQRFVTPIDPTGIGMVTRYNKAPVIQPNPLDPIVPYNIGADGRGRVSFMHYFRPPGVPLDVDDNSLIDLNVANVPLHRMIPNSGTNADPSYVLETNRHNAYHGFHSFLFPAGGNGYLMAGMPYDLSNENATLPRDAGTLAPTAPTNLFDVSGGASIYVGTFSPTINSNPFGRLRGTPIDDGAGNPIIPHLGTQAPFLTQAQTPVHSYPLGSPLLNDPNEMNLYWPDPNDQPFGPADLEWLYRFGDSDGTSLQSRLSDLAPISFVAATDSLARRRMFSVETWDRIDYSFANDHPESLGTVYLDPTLHPVPNPSGSIFLDPALRPVPFNAALPVPTIFLAPGDPSRPAGPLPQDLATLLVRQSRPQANARFAADASASYDLLGLTNSGVTHGGRRINLNHPFPHSYDPYEPVRQKWIGETYEALKAMLPPHAIDTPHELAKLGQFVVNIVDFRDPDNTITIWRNPDIVHLPARRISSGGNDYDLPPSIHLAYRADGSADPWYSDALAQPLVQYGMEYQPVALNEVLGFRFNFARDEGGGTFSNAPATRLYIELVNMLSRPSGPSNTANDLDMQGWDFVLVKEEHAPTYSAGNPYNHPVYVRPDPITGQIPAASLPDPDDLPIAPDGPAVTVNAGQSQAVLLGPGTAPDRTDLNTYQDSYRNSALATAERVPAMRTNGDPADMYYVIGGLRTDGIALPPNYEDNPPDIDHEFAEDTWEMLPEPNDPAFANSEGMYYWLYLRRPANPLLPPDPVENPMVVVDSIRFPFSASDGEGQVTGTDDVVQTPADQPVYSIQRPQPYRGGQIVPDPEDTTLPLFVYGSSEQARPAEGNSNFRTLFDTPATGEFPTTELTHQTIGGQNRAGRYATGGVREAFDYFPFNDRDFMSVAELMLVPACPPGLFTKQFIERPPTLIASPRSSDSDNDGGVDRIGAFAPTPPGNGGGKYGRVPLDTITPLSPVDGMSQPFAPTMVRTYPYLAHEFFYTSDPSNVIDPIAPNGALGLGQSFHLVGGSTSAGWHRMLELFEVPSPVIDAIGPVAQGLNFDWFRQDRRPGQLNLNLILDEEVFFGLLDDPRLLDATNLQRSLIANAADLPQVVTEVDLDGRPVATYPMADRGFTVFSSDQRGAILDGDPTSASFPWMQMKRSFSDFLKERHGGSGFLFAFGDGATGTNGNVSSPPSNIAHDRPYRSFSYPNIQQTLLRPATLEPSDFTDPPFQPLLAPLTVTVLDPGLKDSQYDYTNGELVDPGFIYEPPLTVTDAGEISQFYGNPFRVDSTGPKPIVAPIPPRRLFQPPDWTADTAAFPETASNAAIGPNQTSEYTPVSNANTGFSSGLAIDFPNNFAPSPLGGNFLSLFPEFTYPGFAPGIDDGSIGGSWVDPASGSSPYLGGSVINADINQPDGTTMPATALPPAGTWRVDQPSGDGTTVVNQDMRRHPYYRTEVLQKVSNLTTPRTHQYAVWVTVGLFEVVRPGDRGQFIPDELGPELGVASGANVRYRSFFVLDRTRATGFNPLRPGDYRDVITYSRRIE